MKKVSTILLISLMLFSQILVFNVSAFEKEVHDFDKIWYDDDVGFNKNNQGDLVLAVTYLNNTFRTIDYCSINFSKNPFYFSITFQEELDTDWEGNIIEPDDGYLYLRKNFVMSFIPDDIKKLACKNIKYETIYYNNQYWFRVYIPSFNRGYEWGEYNDPSVGDKWFTWGNIQSVVFQSRAMFIQKIKDTFGSLEFDITHPSNNLGQTILINKLYLQNKGITKPVFEHKHYTIWNQISYKENENYYIINPIHFSTIGIHESSTGNTTGNITDYEDVHSYNNSFNVTRTIGSNSETNNVTYTSISNFTNTSTQSVIRPEGVGNSTQMDALGYTNNWECVRYFDGSWPGTYVRGRPNWESDLYLTENLPHSPLTINNVSISGYLGIKHNAGSKSEDAEFLLETYSTTYSTSFSQPPDENWKLFSQKWENNPFTSNTWTEDEVTDMQIGTKGKGDGDPWDYGACGQVWATVNHSGYVTNSTVKLSIPVSNSVTAITRVYNYSSNVDMTEVDSYSEIEPGDYFYDSTNQFVYIGVVNVSYDESLTYQVNCSYGGSFEINPPGYLNSGDNFACRGVIKDSNGDPISGFLSTTNIIHQNGSIIASSQWNCTNGNYECDMATTNIPPGVYDVEINYEDTDTGVTFKKGYVLYLGTNPSSNVYVGSCLHFSFYNNNTGEGINSEKFKIYVSENRIYRDTYETYTGETVYYRVDDFFDNQIYPQSGYQSVVINTVEQFENIPIDWSSFSVKNMNHSIVLFKMINGSRTYSQYLYPYEPFYWNVLPGEYTINLTYYNTDDDSIESYSQENITISDDTYYWIRGYDLQDIVIEITNTNTTIMDQIVNIGVTINNDGCDIINQVLNTSIAISNLETNITNQVNLVWSSVNNTKTTIVNQVNSVWQSVNNTETEIGVQANSVKQTIQNTETNMTAQINSVWQSINNTDTNVGNQANLIRQDISNVNNNITTQVNGIWQDVNNSNSTIHTQLNSVIQDIVNVDSNISTQVNFIRQDINNAESNITIQLNSIWQDINNSNSTIHTQINSLIQQLTNVNSSIITQINTVKTDITNTETNITNQINGVSLSITNTETNITNQISLVQTQITNTETNISTQINSVSTSITNTETNITNQLNLIKTAITNTETNLTNQINYINVTVINNNSNISSQLNTIINSISNTDTNITTQANFIMNQITNTETNITNQLNIIQSSITNSEANITAQVNLIWNEINNTNSSIYAQINGISTSITNTETNITNQLNSIQISLTNTETNITNQINSVNINITNSNTSIHNQINALTNTINNNKGDIINQINLIWNEINNTDTNIVTQINGIDARITTMHSNINTSFSYVIANISYFETNITNLITEVNATLLAKLLGVLDNVSSAGTSVFEQVTTVLNNLTQINTSLFGELQTQAFDIMLNITEQADENMNEILNLSSTIGRLIGDNISSMITNITNDIATIMNNVNNLSVNISSNLTVNLTNVLENLSEILTELSLTNVSIGNLINVSIENLTDVTFRMWESTNNSFWSLENRSTVVFNFYNTNQGLGLDRETLQVYINGSRLINNLFYCNNDTKINLTVKDFYNFTLYQNNFTINGSFTFIDLGLTFHSYLFGNKNDDYYMISLLKEGASRWWERGIVPYGEREYMIPSGNYSMRIYDKDYNEIYNNTGSGGDTINNSKVYVIHGTNLTEIISGLSVIRGQLLELGGDLDYALMPDEQIYSYNPCTIFSVFDRIGMLLGQDVWEVCPIVNVIATTENSSYGNSIRSYPLIPRNGTTANGTVGIAEDVMYIFGNSSVNYVNITYTGNGTLYQNTSYIPGRINLNGQNLTITSNSNVYVSRETTYSQTQKFYWNIYNSSVNPGHIEGRPGYHSAGITVSNNLGVAINPVYVFAGFSNKTTPDRNSVRVYDKENGINIERGEDFKVTDGIEFRIQGGLPANSNREFTLSYYKDTAHTFYYEDAQIEIMQYQDEQKINGYSGVYKYSEFIWINDKPLAFRGSLRVKLGFKVDLDIDSVKVIDLDYNHMVDDGDLIIGDNFIWIDNTAMGTVQSGGTRSFGIYFQELQYPGQDPTTVHLSTPFFNLGPLPISIFTILVIIGLIIVCAGAGFMILDKKQRNKYIMVTLLGFAIVVFSWILMAKGV